MTMVEFKVHNFGTEADLLLVQGTEALYSC